VIGMAHIGNEAQAGSRRPGSAPTQSEP